jgi:hypothetical protein
MENLPAILTGLGALAAGVGSVLSANSARKKAAKESTEHCYEQLAGAREEAERYGSALHRLRIRALEAGVELPGDPA